MNAVSKEPFYETGGQKHHNLCSSYRVQSKYLDDKISAEHPGWEICFTSRAEQEMQVRQQRFLVKPETVLVYNAREVHTEVYKENRPADFNAILIEPSFIDEMISELNFKERDVVFDQVSYRPDPYFLQSLKNLFEHRQVEELDPLSLEACLVHLFLELIERFPNSLSSTLSLSKNKSNFPKKVDSIKKEIWESFLSSEMNLSYLSQRCGVSKFHMARLFKRVTGSSIGDYITGLRLAEAKKRLKLSKSNITEISGQVGYSDISSFNKAFKKNTGFSPRDFRFRRRARFS